MKKQEILKEIAKVEAAYDKMEEAHGDPKTSTPEMDASIELQDRLYKELALVKN